jgi:hypothetical protein
MGLLVEHVVVGKCCIWPPLLLLLQLLSGVHAVARFNAKFSAGLPLLRPLLLPSLLLLLLLTLSASCKDLVSQLVHMLTPASNSNTLRSDCSVTSAFGSQLTCWFARITMRKPACKLLLLSRLLGCLLHWHMLSSGASAAISIIWLELSRRIVPCLC